MTLLPPDPRDPFEDDEPSPSEPRLITRRDPAPPPPRRRWFRRPATADLPPDPPPHRLRLDDLPPSETQSHSRPPSEIQQPAQPLRNHPLREIQPPAQPLRNHPLREIQPPAQPLRNQPLHKNQLRDQLPGEIQSRDQPPQPHNQPPHLGPRPQPEPSRFTRPELPHAREHQPRSGRRMLSRLAAAFAILLLFVVVAVLATVLWLRHAMHASLPQLDGQIAVAGLSAPVTVTRNAQGVPSIRAANLDDLLFAQGFITASDRLWQMDMLRRAAAGTLAEILGPSLVEHDRRQRYLQITAAADRAAAALPPDQLHQLQAYARGVNAFIATHRSNLPVEFHLLHYTPAPWSPRDSILVALDMAEDLSTEFPQKLNREEISAYLPADLLPDLYPVGSWRDRPPSQAVPDLSTPGQIIEQIPLDSSQSLNQPPPLPGLPTPQALLALYTAMNAHRCEGCRPGSNNWAVAGSRSASGAPLLSNDMHLSLSVPDIWYEASLHIDPPPAAATTPVDASAAQPGAATANPPASLDVEGFTLPGMPFVVAGRNAHVAWGFTNSGADVQDLRVEHLRGSGSNTEFERPDGTWAPVQHHTELIRVRGGRNVTLDVLTTTHSLGATSIETPILTPILAPKHPRDHRALSLAWPVYDPSTLAVPLDAVDTAPDAASLVAAFANFGDVSLNLVYASAQHIGYHLIGRIPIRGAAPYGSPISPVPVDALDAAQVWSGYIPYSVLPAVLDPPSGVLATANARVAPDEYPYHVANDWIDPYRVERIYKLLEGGPATLPEGGPATLPEGGSASENSPETPFVTQPGAPFLAQSHRDTGGPATNARVPQVPFLAAGNSEAPGAANPSGLTPADMLRIQTDVHSEFDLLLAQRLAYALDHAPPARLEHDRRRLQQAANLLRNWNGDLTPNSPAAAIVAATHAQLWPMLLLPQLRAYDHAHSLPNEPSPESLLALYTWNEKDTALEDLLANTPARWLPPGYANWDGFLAAAVERGLDHAHAPGDLVHWRYGSGHRVDIANPLFGSHGLISRILGRRTGTGPRPIGGDSTTIDATGLHFGPSERFTADLASTDATFANLPTGQSGNPDSSFYLDQFPAWLRGLTFPFALDHPAPTHTLILDPQ